MDHFIKDVCKNFGLLHPSPLSAKSLNLPHWALVLCLLLGQPPSPPPCGRPLCVVPNKRQSEYRWCSFNPSRMHLTKRIVKNSINAIWFFRPWQRIKSQSPNYRIAPKQKNGFRNSKHMSGLSVPPGPLPNDLSEQTGSVRDSWIACVKSA